MAALNAPDIRARIAGEAEESYSAAPDTALERNLARVAKTFRRGDYSRADKDLRGLMRQNPSDPTVSYTYAYVFFMEEKYVAAALVLRRAIDLKGDMASVTKSLLGEFYDADQTADALKKLDKRLEAKADDSDARIVRAWMRLAEGRLEDAKSDVQVLLKDDKDDAEAAHILSLCTP
jgi:thioredoxin-like negative regulator of GroEL